MSRARLSARRYASSREISAGVSSALGSSERPDENEEKTAEGENAPVTEQA